MNNKIRKMQTASGGPIRIQFTPEQIAYFESLGLPLGMNVNSNKTTGESARKAGIDAVRRKQQLLPKRFNIGERHTMVPEKTHQDPITKEVVVDSYKDVGPNGSGAISGADPLLSFYVTGVGLGGAGTLAKIGAWETAKLFPTSYFGNLARLYFVGNAFKNSFNGTIPTLASQTTSLLYLPAKLNESGLTSLKFFERKPSKITEAERAGVPKGERNNINNSGNLEKTVDNIILENRHWLPKETGMFAQKHSSIGSSYRKTFERLWGKENTDRLTDDLLGKLILIRNHLIDTNIPLKGDFVYVVDGQAKAYRNGLEIGYLNNSYIDNGRALHPEMVKKQGTNNAGVSELLYNGTILAENRPIISGSSLLMPEVTTHIWSKYPTRKLISTEGVHAWPLRTAQERGIKLNYEKNWHTLPEFSKLHQLALDENIRTNLIGLPIYELSEPSYLPMVKNARVFDISLLRDGYINLDFTPGFAYKQGGKMNILEFLKNGSGIHIKEKNKGSFTRWCGGNVTEECIRRGKASSNPKIRKKATFADNARHFKHRLGGVFKAQGGTNTGQWVLQIGNLAMQGYNAYNLNLYFNLLAETIKAKSAADEAKYKANMYLNFLKSFNISPEIDNDGNIINKSDLVARNEAYKYALSLSYDDSLMQELLAALALLKSEAWDNFLKGFGNTATNIFSTIAANKLNKNGTPA